jgi:hypothetical protein
VPRHLARTLAAGLGASSAAFALTAALAAGPATATFEDAHLNPDHVGATNPGFEVGSCPDAPEGTPYGWDFAFPDGETAFKIITITFQHAGQITLTFADDGTNHAYVFTADADTIVSGTAGRWGLQDQFDLNGVCAPEEAPPTTAPPTTVPPTTLAPTTTAPAQVAPAVETAPPDAPQTLAFTGSRAAERLRIAAALVAIGSAMVAFAGRKGRQTGAPIA